jgi:predicted transcriptional regulator
VVAGARGHKNLGDLLGPLEREVMAIMWRSGPLSVPEVHARLRRRRAPLAYTSVMTVMSRLNDKGILERQKSGRGYVYRAVADREGTLGILARQQARTLIDDFGDLAVSGFVSEVGDDPTTLRLLEQLLERGERRD